MLAWGHNPVTQEKILAYSYPSPPAHKHTTTTTAIMTQKGLERAKRDDMTAPFCCCSVARSCLTLFRPPVLHHLLESAQTHVHWVGDANQSSHPLSSPSAPAFNLSQHQGLFQWVGSSHQHSTPHENCRECWRENWDRGSVVIQFNMVILVNSQHNRDILMTTCS